MLAIRVRLTSTGNAGLGMTEEVHSLANSKPHPAVTLGAVLGDFIALGLGLILVSW